MATKVLWDLGEPHFKTYEDFKLHCFSMCDKSGGQEYTIYDVSGEPVAYLYMMLSASWHRPAFGLDLTVLAIRPDSQSSRKVLETVCHIVDTECYEFGLTWYQRGKHLTSGRDLIITKELNLNG